MPLFDKEISRRQEVGGARVTMTAEEIEKLRRLTPPGEYALISLKRNEMRNYERNVFVISCDPLCLMTTSISIFKSRNSFFFQKWSKMAQITVHSWPLTEY